jgi:hypothetical protein
MEVLEHARSGKKASFYSAFTFKTNISKPLGH